MYLLIPERKRERRKEEGERITHLFFHSIDSENRKIKDCLEKQHQNPRQSAEMPSSPTAGEAVGRPSWGAPALPPSAPSAAT